MGIMKSVSFIESSQGSTVRISRKMPCNCLKLYHICLGYSKQPTNVPSVLLLFLIINHFNAIKEKTENSIKYPFGVTVQK